MDMDLDLGGPKTQSKNGSTTQSQSNELTKGTPELVLHFCLYIGGVHINLT
jgi:hypothetical protein